MTCQCMLRAKMMVTSRKSTDPLQDWSHHLFKRVLVKDPWRELTLDPWSWFSISSLISICFSSLLTFCFCVRFSLSPLKLTICLFFFALSFLLAHARPTKITLDLAYDETQKASRTFNFTNTTTTTTYFSSFVSFSDSFRGFRFVRSPPPPL